LGNARRPHKEIARGKEKRNANAEKHTPSAPHSRIQTKQKRKELSYQGIKKGGEGPTKKRKQGIEEKLARKGGQRISRDSRKAKKTGPPDGSCNKKTGGKTKQRKKKIPPENHVSEKWLKNRRHANQRAPQHKEEEKEKSKRQGEVDGAREKGGGVVKKQKWPSDGMDSSVEAPMDHGERSK